MSHTLKEKQNLILWAKRIQGQVEALVRAHTCDRLVNQGSRDVDDAARFLPQHLLHGEL